MKNNKTVLVAADSETMRILLKKMLETSGYTVITASDGLEVLELVHASKPDCLVVYAYLPVLNGFSLSRILKNTRSLSDIAVVICVTETSTVFRFWSDNANCNALYVVDHDTGDTLCNIVADAIASESEHVHAVSKNQELQQTDSIPDAARLLELTTSSYERELFTHYVMAAAYEAGVETFSLDRLVERMIHCLSGVCNYHALAVIVNDDPVIEYLDISPSIDSRETADFRQVCKTDFMTQTSGHVETWQLCNVSNSCIIAPEENSRLKSYEFFVLSGTVFSGTVHVGSCQNDAFDERNHERMVFFITVFSRILELALKYRRTYRAEQRMRQAFSRFVPPEIIDSLIAGDNSLGATIGEKRKVAILIADIRNFTGISEINKPEDVVAFLNQYFTVMVTSIKKYGGSIDKFMGDAIMALFGATMSYEDNGNRAALAAIEMIDSLSKIDTSRIVLPPGFTFKIGIGIHYGDVIVGSIGCADKTDYTVIGDSVNLASRIEGLTKQYGVSVIVTGSVKDDLRGAFQIRHMDNVKVKGKSLPVSIYELRSPADNFPEIFLSNYEKGIALYEKGAWNLASKYFSSALQDFPDDRATKMLLERCEQYAVSPPVNWDGAVTVLTK